MTFSSSPSQYMLPPAIRKGSPKSVNAVPFLNTHDDQSHTSEVNLKIEVLNQHLLTKASRFSRSNRVGSVGGLYVPYEVPFVQLAAVERPSSSMSRSVSPVLASSGSRRSRDADLTPDAPSAVTNSQAILIWFARKRFAG